MVGIRTLVLLTGANRCGKDTVANVFSDISNFAHMKISDPLKDLVNNLFQIPVEVRDTNKKDTERVFHDKTYRDLLQFIGTDMFQHKWSEFDKTTPKRCLWIALLEERIRRHQGNVVVSDLRFHHEIEYLRDYLHDYNIVTILISRHGKEPLPSHESDSSYQQVRYDHHFKNDGTRDDITPFVQTIIRHYNET